MSQAAQLSGNVPVAPVITANNIAASQKIAPTSSTVEAKTYIHSVKFSTFIMPSGQILQFMPVGRIGHLTTTCPYEQAELDAAVHSGGHIRHLNAGTVDPVRIEATPAERAREALLAANSGNGLPAEQVQNILKGAVNSNSGGQASSNSQ